MNDDGVGEDLIVLGADVGEPLRRQRLRVLVAGLGILRLGPELLDDREIHHLIEGDGRIGDRPDPAVEVIGLLPDPLEVGRVVAIDEELVVLGPVRGVRVAEHPEGVGGGDVVAGRHQLGGLRLPFLRLQHFHRIEDAANDRLDLVGVVLGEVGPGKPHVGDQPVGRLRRDQQPVSLRLGEVVDVGRPRYRPGDLLLGIEGRRRLEGVVGVDHVDVAGLETAGDEHVEGEELARRILREDEFLAGEIADGADPLADDDPVTAIGEVNLLVDAGHHPGVLGGPGAVGEPLEEQRHHVERRPTDVDLAGGVRVAHRDGIVDEHQFDLERLPTWCLPHLPRLEALIGVDDRRPARPDVEGEADGVVLERLVGAGSLHRRQLLGRLEGVFLDGRRHGVIGSLRDRSFARWWRPAASPTTAVAPGSIPPRTGAARGDLRSSGPGTEHVPEHPGPPGCQGHQAEDHRPDRKPERSFGLTTCHRTPRLRIGEK